MPGRSRLHVLDAERPARPQRPGQGHAAPERRGSGQREGSTRRPALPHRRPRPAGRRRRSRGSRRRLAPLLSDYRLVMVDQRGTGGTAIRCPQLQAQVGTSDIAVPSAAAVRACAARARTDTRPLLDRRDTSPTWTSSGRRSASRPGRSTASPTGPSSPSATRSPTRRTCGRSSSTRCCRTSIPRRDDALYLTGLQATGRVLRAACADLGCGFDPAADLAWVVRHGVDAACRSGTRSSPTSSSTRSTGG